MKTTSAFRDNIPADSKLLINIKLAALVIVTLFTMALKSRGNEAFEQLDAKQIMNSTLLSWVICLL